jgi:hypothetical protein
MNKFAIIPDSSCDLSKDMREKLGIEYYAKGVVAFPDGHSEYADLDWSTLTPEEYFNAMRSKNALCTTSAAAPDEIASEFEKAAQRGMDILSISIVITQVNDGIGLTFFDAHAHKAQCPVGIGKDKNSHGYHPLMFQIIPRLRSQSSFIPRRVNNWAPQTYSDVETNSSGTGGYQDAEQSGSDPGGHAAGADSGRPEVDPASAGF